MGRTFVIMELKRFLGTDKALKSFVLLVLALSSIVANPRIVSAAGTLEQSARGEYFIISGKSRSRRTYVLVCKNGDEEAFKALEKLVGKEIKIEGEEISRKSPWNITVELVSVSAEEERLEKSLQKSCDML